MSEAVSLRKLLNLALGALYAECDGRCAPQNPCAARESILEINKRAKKLKINLSKLRKIYDPQS